MHLQGGLHTNVGSPHVRSHSCDGFQRRFGYSIEGGSGPTLVATGFRGACERPFRHIARIPTIGRLRGTLVLALIEETPARSETALWKTLDALEIDDILFVGNSSVPHSPTHHDQEVFWTILHKCHEIGMISGRGLPRSRRRTFSNLYEVESAGLRTG